MPVQTLAETFPEPQLFDETEVEVLRGIELPKMSPKRRHGRLQAALAASLEEWAGDCGEVATEWRFWLAGSPAVDQTTLVPDVAFVSVERMAPLSDEEAEEPPFAPDVAIEIRSPGDRARNIRTKAALYLAAGSRLVLDVDSRDRRIVAYDRTGEHIFPAGAVFEHAEVPGFTFDVSGLFDRAERKRH